MRITETLIIITHTHTEAPARWIISVSKYTRSSLNTANWPHKLVYCFKQLANKPFCSVKTRVMTGMDENGNACNLFHSSRRLKEHFNHILAYLLKKSQWRDADRGNCTLPLNTFYSRSCLRASQAANIVKIIRNESQICIYASMITEKQLINKL